MTSTDWSREEVEATVADYFEMWSKEIRGEEYNKTEHRKNLTKLLNGRSDTAIERKHMNISAVLNDLDYPSIIGYKPLHNYQRLLLAIVSERLEARPDIVRLVQDHVEQPAKLPTIDDILEALVEAPAPSSRERSFMGIHETPRLFKGINYLEKEAHNRSLGDAGEEFVVRFEQERLRRNKHEKLADKVIHASKMYGDGLGFDVLSFDLTGRELYIEVKTTAHGPLTPFFITSNELEVSHKDGYYLYRNFDFRRNPKLFTKQGPLDKSFVLEPSQYTANVG